MKVAVGRCSACFVHAWPENITCLSYRGVIKLVTLMCRLNVNILYKLSCFRNEKRELNDIKFDFTPGIGEFSLVFSGSFPCQQSDSMFYVKCDRVSSNKCQSRISLKHIFMYDLDGAEYRLYRFVTV